MTITQHPPILSYAEINIPNPGDDLQQQGIQLLQQLLAMRLIKTDQFMIYRAHEQQEVRIAADPYTLVSVTAASVRLEQVDTSFVRQEPLGSDPLKQVEKLLATVPVPNAVAYGYIAFDMIRCYMSSATMQDLQAPLLAFFVPRLEVLLSPDNICIRSLDVLLLEQVLDVTTRMSWRSTQPLTTPEHFPIVEDDASWYMHGVQTITDAIHHDLSINGPFQKAILSRAVTVSQQGDLDLLETYRLAEEHNTSVRSYCFHLGEDAAVGCSPETLLEADTTGLVASNPLAGTRWRGKTPEEDARLTKELGASHKQRTEHLLSVLEVQRELESVCINGSVNVRGLAHIQKYRTVQHLASRLCGYLSSPYTVWDAVRVLFPGVTVSGIAKPVSLDWITQLEPTPRGMYAGAIGWVSSDGSADLAIAIRTIFQRGKRVMFQAGAGIVADSDPQDEYEETWHKMQTMWPFMVRARVGEGDEHD